MARHSALRASDADRDAVAERLRQAAVEGRLEPWELEERLDTALRARTYGELDPLLRDLPGRSLARPARARPPVSAVSAAGLAMFVIVRVVVLLLVVAALLAAIAVSAAWWLIGLVVWLSLRSRRSCSGFHRPPRARRVY